MWSRSRCLFAWLMLPVLVPSMATAEEDSKFTLVISGQTMGEETIRPTDHGWESEGFFDLPGQGRSDYTASVSRVDQSSSWKLQVKSGGIDVTIEATHDGERVKGSIEPGSVPIDFAVASDHPICFWENLVWGCFVDIGRRFAPGLADGSVAVGAVTTAVLCQTGNEFEVKLEEHKSITEVVGGTPMAIHLLRVSFAGQDMIVATDATGWPVGFAVPAQQLRVEREGAEHLTLSMRDPFTLVDSGPWRETLSAPSHEVIVEENVKITMGDGTVLVADIHRPVTEKRCPAILVRTPYNRKNEALGKGMFYAERGYALIAQDVRGRFESEGDWFPLRYEATDGSDTLDWIADQDWCDGNIGMIGGSYVGWVQWYAASTGNPHLKAIVPQVAPPDPDENIPYEGGAFLLSSAWWAKVLEFMEAGGVGLPDLDWLEVMRTVPLSDLDQALGCDHPFLDEWLAHSPVDEYWDSVRYQPHFDQMHVAALHVSGWYDGDQPGSLQNFVGMQARARTKQARDGQFLVMGPWGHAINVTRKMGHVDFGEEAIVDLDALYIRFFDRYLKGVDNGIDDEDPVMVFVMGENKWHREADWPLPQTKFTRLALGSEGDAKSRDGDGLLFPWPGISSAPFDEYLYDPHDLPEFDIDFNDVTGGQATADQSTMPDRDDDLDYVTPPLASPIEITGPVEVMLSVSSSAADADFSAALLRRTPDGKLYRIAGGIQRVRYRNGRDEPVPPGEVVQIRIDCWATSVRVPAGDRLHLAIGSSGWPGFSRNPGTLEPLAEATEYVAATQRVHHDDAHPSYVLLPIVPREGATRIQFHPGQ